MEVVAVIGASSDHSRYSYQAMEMLAEYGHKAIPVHPREEEVLGQKVIHKLGELTGQKIDTITVYVNSAISDKYEKEMIAVHPKRVIFNPGAENPKLARALQDNGIEVENACTLVLLRTNQY
jgi:predicted CoA-binding protein